eukprot:scaffold8269_cov286-Pinguiococcus_pyrenoidosus.AAC.2
MAPSRGCSPLRVFAVSVVLFGVLHFLRLSPLVKVGQASTSTKTTPFSLLQESLRHMKTEVQRHRAAIRDYYKGDDLLLEPRVAPDAKQEDVLVARLAKRIGEGLLGISGPEHAPRFDIACIGSSVTAGHDVFGHVAFPAVLQRQLAPMFSAAGVQVHVENLAVGGRGPWLSGSLCLEAVTGPNVDVILREWAYWPLDDGLGAIDLSRQGADRQAAAVELFLRTAFRLPSQPAVHFLSLSYDTPPGTIPGEAGLVQQLLSTTLEAYKDYPLGFFSAFGHPFDHLRRKNKPINRVTKTSFDSVLGAKAVRWNLGPAELKACEETELMDVRDCPVDYVLQDGYHQSAADLGLPSRGASANSTDGVGDPYRILSRWFPEIFHDLFVNWHPGVLGHEVRCMLFLRRHGVPHTNPLLASVRLSGCSWPTFTASTCFGPSSFCRQRT